MIASKTDGGYTFRRRKSVVKLPKEDQAAVALWKLLEDLADREIAGWSTTAEGGVKISNTDEGAAHAFKVACQLRERKHLSESIPTSNRVRWLLKEVRPKHRQLLSAVAVDGPISQLDLMAKLNMTEVDFRGCVAGLAKIAKRLGVPYPLVASGYDQDSRSYTLEASARKTVLAVLGKRAHSR